MHPAISLLDSELFTEKGRVRLVRRARLVTYASLAVTLAGGLSGIVAALTLDRLEVLMILVIYRTETAEDVTLVCDMLEAAAWL